jgi:C1A family cysteine protease
MAQSACIPWIPSFMTHRKKATYLIESATGKRIKLGGALASSQRPDTAQAYAPGRFAANDLPPRVDLRPHMTAVEDQSEVNSCTANAIAGAYEYLIQRSQGDAVDISRLFIYYNARQYDGIQGDQGSTITGSIHVLETIGTCTESTWTYAPHLVDQQPHSDAYEEASQFQVKEADEIPVDLYAMKHCLAEGYPFAFGLALFGSFDRAGKHGLVSAPEPNAASRTSHGNHAMLCVGYSDQSQSFIVRNSWGESWGEQGYCYIPYDYLANPDYCGDCWAIRTVSDLDLSQGVWIEDDFSIFDVVGDLLDDETEDSGYTYDYVEFNDIDAIDSAIDEDNDSESTESVDIEEEEYSEEDEEESEDEETEEEEESEEEEEEYSEEEDETEEEEEYSEEEEAGEDEEEYSEEDEGGGDEEYSEEE